MERSQHPSVRARFMDGSYRSPFLVDLTPSCTPTPEPEIPTYALSHINEPPSSDSCDQSSPQPESISAPTRLGPCPPELFYTLKPLQRVSAGGKAPSQKTSHVACRAGWKGYDQVAYDYLHPKDKYVDVVPLYAQRTRSSRRQSMLKNT
jgi:hypothetical protein